MRTTDEPKEYVLKVRITEEMRRYLETVSGKNKISLSSYVRQLVKDNMTFVSKNRKSN